MDDKYYADLAMKLECESQIKALSEWIVANPSGKDSTREEQQEKEDKKRSLLMWRGRLSMLCRDALTFVCDDKGASLIEYGLLLALITLVCMGAIAMLGNSISEMLGSIAGKI